MVCSSLRFGTEDGKEAFRVEMLCQGCCFGGRFHLPSAQGVLIQISYQSSQERQRRDLYSNRTHGY